MHPRHCERNAVVAFSREEQSDVAGGKPERVRNRNDEMNLDFLGCFVAYRSSQ
jgi:hypothetical protein